ncbi:MAG: hypothetical protein ACR5K5_01585 [Wolbachia sp.]
MLKNLPYVVIPAHNAEIQIYRNGLNEKLLDKPRQPPYYDNKSIYDSKLVFDLQTKFSKKLRVFIGGLHKIIAAACLFYFFYIQPNRAYFKR